MLLAGDPGIGKSTLVLQLAATTAKGKRVLYASGEESAAQIKLRADRLGVGDAQLDLVSETSVEAIIALLQNDHYDLAVIDSIQTMATNDLPAAAGSIAQVTASAQTLITAAKQLTTAILMIGHVTKEGSIAGPKILEHLVDVVLYLEGERYGNFKALRGVKNRFGSTNEVGIFEMTDRGMAEVANPSAALLAERQPAPGSVVLVTMEGSRPILVEVQALVVPSPFGYPKRTANGVDLNRLQLLVAVLTKRAGLNLSSADVYVNIVGGLKVTEPACDLAIILSIVSALEGHQLDPELAVFGEVGLSGELRTVTRRDARVAEARKLGFKRILAPRAAGPTTSGLVIASTVREAIELGLKPAK